MGNIVEDIVEDIDIKPSKSKLVVKWVIRISVLAICAAFIIGEFKVKAINRINNLENEQKAINNKVDKNYENLDHRIDENLEKQETKNTDIYDKLYNLAKK